MERVSSVVGMTGVPSDGHYSSKTCGNRNVEALSEVSCAVGFVYLPVEAHCNN